MSVFGYKKKTKEQFLNSIEESLPSVSGFEDAVGRKTKTRTWIPIASVAAACLLAVSVCVPVFLSNQKKETEPLNLCEDTNTWIIGERLETTETGYLVSLGYGISHRFAYEGMPLVIEADGSDVEFSVNRLLIENSVDGLTQDQEYISNEQLLKTEGSMEDYWNKENVVSIGDFSSENDNPYVFPYTKLNIKYPYLIQDILTSAIFTPTKNGNCSIGWLCYSVRMIRKDGEPFVERGKNGGVATEFFSLGGSISCHYVYGNGKVSFFQESEPAKSYYDSLISMTIRTEQTLR